MTLAVVTAITTLFVVPLGLRCYDYPRKAFFAVTALPLIGWYLREDMFLNCPLGVLTCLAVLLGWWFVRSSLSEDVRTALSHTFLFSLSAVGALTMLSVLSIQTVFLTLAMAGYANAIIAILQHFGIRLVPKELTGKRLTEAIEKCIGDGSMRENAQKAAESIKKRDGVAATVRVIEDAIRT